MSLECASETLQPASEPLHLFYKVVILKRAGGKRGSAGSLGGLSLLLVITLTP